MFLSNFVDMMKNLQQGQVPRGGNGLQIPTSMEQMKGQATTLYAGMKEKIAPTPPPQPPSNDPQGGSMLISGGGDAHDTDHVIGGKIFYICKIMYSKYFKH